jgi:hypothetical protein
VIYVLNAKSGNVRKSVTLALGRWSATLLLMRGGGVRLVAG